MSGKEKMSDALFDAVGCIDEKYIKEASDYRGNKKKLSLLRTASLIAAAVVLVFAVSIPAITGLNSLIDRYGKQTAPSSYAVMKLNEGDKLDLKTAALIWQKAGQTGYSYVELTGSGAERMIGYVTSKPVAAKSDIPVKVWIKLDNGEYVSPQLKQSPGNTGIDLFDFSPELELSSTISNAIERYESGDKR